MSPGPKPGPRPRQMGGFNPGMGMSNEHLDEAAFKSAGQQKQLTQQQASTQPASGKSGTDPLLSQSETNEAVSKNQPDKARDIGGFKQELVDRPLNDIKKELAQFVDLQSLFEINNQDSPEEQMKKKALHQRWQKLDQEQQQVAQKKYQEELKKKQQMEEEEEQKKQEAEAKKDAEPLAPPTSPQKGPVGLVPGLSRKKKAQALVQQSRTGLSSSNRKY